MVRNNTFVGLVRISTLNTRKGYRNVGLSGAGSATLPPIDHPVN